ncbi:hypothetical protein [Ascidiimonas sp. W6]|uniref:hypothetical protein n=1 Tax=Ascidiimonas meishanensis TaxID=3128903 RepID=UPI0030EDC762
MADSTDLSSIHVLNKTLGRFTITDENGAFSIRVRLKDTLVFSSVQFQREEFQITPTVFKSGFIEVTLEVKVNELDEITLRPHNLTGDLSKDLNQVDQDKIITGVRLGLPNQYVKSKTQSERRIYEATTGGGIIPLNPILNAISGRTKRLKQQLKLERQTAKSLTVMNAYDRRVYSETFNIPDEYIEGFIIYCAQDANFESIRQTSDLLVMLEYLEKKSKEYNSLGVFIPE